MKNIALLSCDTTFGDKTLGNFVRIVDTTSPLIFIGCK